MKNEETLQIAVSKFLKLKYPSVIFTAESSGIRLTIGQAVKAKKQRNPERGIPDIIILEPSNGYHGLCIELKKGGTRLKNGSIPNTKHTKEQAAVLDRLRQKGYLAEFAVGIDEAMQLIDNYLK